MNEDEIKTAVELYVGVLVELYKHDIVLQEQFLWLLIENLELTWRRGQHYRTEVQKTINKARHMSIDPRAKKIDAYIIQCTYLALYLSDRKLIIVSDEQRKRLFSIAQKVVTVQDYSQEDVYAFVDPLITSIEA